MQKRPANSSERVLALLEQHGPQTSRELLPRTGLAPTYVNAILLDLHRAKLIHISGHKRGAGTNSARIYAAGNGKDARYCPTPKPDADIATVERAIEERHGSHMMAAIRNAMKSDQPRRIYVGGRLIYSRETGIVEDAA